MKHGVQRVITTPLVRSIVRYASGLSFDSSDLADGTLLLDFLSAVPEQTLGADFMADTYIVWVEHPAWPYGVAGVFQAKGY